MNIRIFCLLFFAAIISPLAAGNPIVVGETKNTQGTFTLVRTKINGQTTLDAEFNHGTPPIWTKTWPDGPDGTSLLDYWQIIDGCNQGKNVAFLIGMHRGLLWVKATNTNGLWNIDFAQELYGVASLGLKTWKIALNGTDRVVVTNDQGVATTFIRNATGSVLKDGAPFNNTPPYSTITKP
ncbi:MAG: hypothetical protein WCD79_14000 [Chthoniobacteraceae bacterium]